MSIYRIISQQSITSPFIDVYNTQSQLINQINYIFENYLKNQVKFNDYTNFNNYLSDELKNIINSNTIIFNGKNIILFNFVELMFHQTTETQELLVKFLHPANSKYLKIIDCINIYYVHLLKILKEWNIIYDKFIGIEFNESSLNQLNILKQKILNGNIDKNEFFILPFKNHLIKYCKDFVESLNLDINLLNLMINFESNELETKFKYDIFLIKNEDIENKNESIISDIIEKDNIDNFLKNLFFYGKI